MENTNRNIFSLSGITGMLIATVLLLSILTVLTYMGIKEQQRVANKPYDIPQKASIAKISKENAKLKVVKE